MHKTMESAARSWGRLNNITGKAGGLYRADGSRLARSWLALAAQLREKQLLVLAEGTWHLREEAAVHLAPAAPPAAAAPPPAEVPAVRAPGRAPIYYRTLLDGAEAVLGRRVSVVTAQALVELGALDLRPEGFVVNTSALAPQADPVPDPVHDAPTGPYPDEGLAQVQLDPVQVAAQLQAAGLVPMDVTTPAEDELEQLLGEILDIPRDGVVEVPDYVPELGPEHLDEVPHRPTPPPLPLPGLPRTCARRLRPAGIGPAALALLLLALGTPADARERGPVPPRPPVLQEQEQRHGGPWLPYAPSRIPAACLDTACPAARSGVWPLRAAQGAALTLAVVLYAAFRRGEL